MIYGNLVFAEQNATALDNSFMGSIYEICEKFEFCESIFQNNQCLDLQESLQLVQEGFIGNTITSILEMIKK